MSASHRKFVLKHIWSHLFAHSIPTQSTKRLSTHVRLSKAQIKIIKSILLVDHNLIKKFLESCPYSNYADNSFCYSGKKHDVIQNFFWHFPGWNYLVKTLHIYSSRYLIWLIFCILDFAPSSIFYFFSGFLCKSIFHSIKLSLNLASDLT